MTDPRIQERVDRHVRTELVRFLRALRRHGVDVPANAGTLGFRALAEVGLSERDRVRTALYATLLADEADAEAFDRLFSAFWDRLTAGADGERGDASAASEDELTSQVAAPTPDAPPEEGANRASGNEGETEVEKEEIATRTSFEVTTDALGDGDDEDDEETIERAAYSPTGSASAVGGEPVPASPGLGEVVHALGDALSGLRGRRYGRGGDRPDPRRVLRESVSTGGTVLSVPKRERRRSAVRALFLVDVSRSVLDSIDRGFLIEFLRRAAGAWRDVRTFFFDEDLREVTDAVDAPSATAVRDALQAAETAWGGGTRIGESLSRLRERAPEAVDRRTVTFLVSDGLEMGDVEGLEREIARLSRRTKRLFWLNPLAAAEAYEPTARGMAAALPHVDALFAFASPADVAEIARQLVHQGPGGRIGYEYDSRAASGTDRRGNGTDRMTATTHRPTTSTDRRTTSDSGTTTHDQ